jgi:hypothetical protein
MTAPVDVAELSFQEVDAFPPLASIGHGELFALRLSNNTATRTHGLHRFPAKFVPQVPAWALGELGGPGTVALDPFMGLGTTLVEGVVRGGTTIGVDVDPFARLLAGAKVTAVPAARMEQLAAELLDRWRAPAAVLRVPLPGVVRFDHWFRPGQWAWLQSLHDQIMGLGCTDAERRFLLVVFSSVLRRVSNADDQTQKTYVSGTLRKDPPPVPATFRRVLARALDGLAELERDRHPDAVARIPAGGDARRLECGPVDLIVTSPPYLDSVDYPYNMMLEYFWLGPHLGVEDRRALNLLRRRPIGAKQPLAPEPLPAVLDGLTRLDVLPPARRPVAASYFALMAGHFAEAAQVLRPGGRYVLVVGNSASRSDVLPVHQALVALAAGAGLHLETGFGYRVRRHSMRFPRAGRGGIILLDWVLVLRRSDGGGPAVPEVPWVTLAPGAVAH